MKESIKIVSVLTLICLICGFFLAYTYQVSKEKIVLNEQKAINDAIYDIVPSCAAVKPVKVKGEEVYKLFGRQNNLLGYAFLASGNGYQGKIKILAALKQNLEDLYGIEIIDSVETPGLGAKIKEPFFKNQFRNLEVMPEITYTKTKPTKPNEIKAITGATISSRSVVNILNKEISRIRKILK